MGESDTGDVAAFFEQELGLPEGFFAKLMHEDDWSFVIKLHAFFEGVITQLLVKSLGKEKLRGVLAELPLSDKRIGKIVFARQLGLLEDQPRRFISDLSALLNDLVHDVKNVQFNLKEHVKRLDKNKRRNFRDNFGFAFGWLEQGSERREALMTENPKLILLGTAYECLILIYLKRMDARAQQLEAALARAIYEQTQAKSEGSA